MKVLNQTKYLCFIALMSFTLVGCGKASESINEGKVTDKQELAEDTKASDKQANDQKENGEEDSKVEDNKLEDTYNDEGESSTELDEKQGDDVNIFAFTPTVDQPESRFLELEMAPTYKELENHNPLISQRFGADPFAMVYKDRVYVYMTNDSQQLSFDANGKALENTYSSIRSLNVISSDDLVNWTDHGTINVGKPNGATWWANNSWAPAAAYKNIDGKDQFFIYFANSAGGIGVLRGDSPVGPFKDPIGKPLITKETENCSDVVWLFDPAVLVDDDGKAYLYFGGGVPDGKEEMPNTARVVELGSDMISLAGTPVVIEAPYLFEDSGINKIGDTYYYSYCSNWASRDGAVGPYKPGAAEVIYMTSKNPMGPWEYQGSILQNPGKFFGTWGNNHHSIVNFKDQWYIFYHTQFLQDSMKIKGGYRSTHVDEVMIENGVIKNIIATKSGVTQLHSVNPYVRNEAEAFAWNGGVAVKKINRPSSKFGEVNTALYDLQAGDWVGVSDVDFGQLAPKEFIARVSSEVAGSLIRISVDSFDGEVIAYVEVPVTTEEDGFVDVLVEVENITGVHDVYFTFSGEGIMFDSWLFR